MGQQCNKCKKRMRSAAGQLELSCAHTADAVAAELLRLHMCTAQHSDQIMAATLHMLPPPRRYVPSGPGGASLLAKPAPAERRFEGIRLESPGPNLPSGPLQHLQICSECYNAEGQRVAAGQKSRLPGGLTLGDLVQTVRGGWLHSGAAGLALGCTQSLSVW